MLLISKYRALAFPLWFVS